MVGLLAVKYDHFDLNLAVIRIPLYKIYYILYARESLFYNLIQLGTRFFGRSISDPWSNRVGLDPLLVTRVEISSKPDYLG